MPINVAWQDEQGRVLERWGGFVHIDLFEQSPATACLRFIDPYGDTVFNRYQIPVLVLELQKLVQQLEGKDRESIQDLLVFLAKADKWVCPYVRFLGD